MLTQTTYKYSYLSTLESSGNKPHIEPNPVSQKITCQDRNGRKCLPRKGFNNNRSLSFTRPRSSYRRPLREAAFVKERKRSSYSLGFFLMRGQSYLSQCRTAFSSFSLACLIGRWQLQPREPNSFHTWPRWYLT